MNDYITNLFILVLDGSILFEDKPNTSDRNDLTNAELIELARWFVIARKPLNVSILQPNPIGYFDAMTIVTLLLDTFYTQVDSGSAEIYGVKWFDHEDDDLLTAYWLQLKQDIKTHIIDHI